MDVGAEAWQLDTWYPACSSGHYSGYQTSGHVVSGLEVLSDSHWLSSLLSCLLCLPHAVPLCSPWNPHQTYLLWHDPNVESVYLPPQ